MVVTSEKGLGVEADAQIGDAEVMSSALLLRRLYEDRIRRRRARARGVRFAGRRPSVPERPLTLVLEFHDALTRRLLRRRPDLLTPDQHFGLASDDAYDVKERSTNAVDAPVLVEEVYLHRSYLETTALSISAHSHADWAIMQLLLTHNSGADVRAMPVTRWLAPAELYPKPGSAASRRFSGEMSESALSDASRNSAVDRLHGRLSNVASCLREKKKKYLARFSVISTPSALKATVSAIASHRSDVSLGNEASSADGAPALWSFHALASRVSACGEGMVLLGWRRSDAWPTGGSGSFASATAAPNKAAETQPKLLNPPDKELPLRWCADDILLVLHVERGIADSLERGEATDLAQKLRTKWKS